MFPSNIGMDYYEENGLALFPEYDNWDGIAIAQLIRQREITSEDVLSAIKERVDRLNPALNAVINLTQRPTIGQPGLVLPDSPLAGVPIFIKDLMADISGEQTRSGSKLFADYVAPQDTEIIRRYRKAGLIFAAKTTTPEFGLMPMTESALTGLTRNPWDLRLTPGGSSGGSAAVVAAGIVPIAHGGDGGGSIRIPASNCGVFGLKPSRGRSPYGPNFSEGWQGFVSQHALTRSVRDSAAMLDALIDGYDPNDAYYCPPPDSSFLSSLASPGPRLRIAYTTKAFMGGPLHPDCLAALEHSVKLLTDLGHHVEEAHPPLCSPEQMCRAMLVLVAGETACLMRNAKLFVGRAATYRDVEPATWAMARYGELLSAGEFAWMRDFALLQGRLMHQFHQKYDVLMTPVVNQLPAEVGTLGLKDGERRLSTLLIGQFGWDWPLKVGNLIPDNSRRLMEYIGWTIPFNMSGQPAMSVPLFWNQKNIPIGTQMVGRYGHERTLLQLARELEQAQPWFDKRPALII